jgi:hypothetical protein
VIPRVLWRSGDDWRNMTDEVRAVDAVTIVSRSGAARFLDLERRRHDRRPLEGGDRMCFDGVWRPLEGINVTPCGTDVFGALDWAKGTPIWIVVTDIHPDWPTLEWGRPIVDAIIAGKHPSAPGHPRWRCGALHCRAQTSPRPGPATGTRPS